MIASHSVKPADFVLSAGRTGTVFLTNLFEQFDGVEVVHEPFPARYELVLGNIRNDLGIGRSLVRNLFVSARSGRFSESEQDKQYIEINPLICPVIDQLKELKRPLQVVHMVREPLSWAKSICAFRASKFVRPLYPLIPFANPYPSPRPEGWRELSNIEKQLWRWRFCNEQILAHKSEFSRYTLIRYEDLFCQDEEIRESNLRRICEVFQLPFEQIDVSTAFEQRKNPAPKRDVEDVSIESIERICGGLAVELGYMSPMTSIGSN